MTTPEQIRQIASYYGASFSYELEITVFDSRYSGLKVDGIIPMDCDESYWATIPKLRIDGHSLTGLMFANIRNLKLHLRKLESLSDEEVRDVFALAFPGYTCEEIARDQTTIYAGHEYIGLRLDSEHGHYTVYEYKTGQSLDSLPFAVVSYLLSLHVYMPGMIGAEWVNLETI